MSIPPEDRFRSPVTPGPKGKIDLGKIKEGLKKLLPMLEKIPKKFDKFIPEIDPEEINPLPDPPKENNKKDIPPPPK